MRWTKSVGRNRCNSAFRDEPSRVVSLAPAYVWESTGTAFITVIGEKEGNLSVLEGRGVCDMVICEDVVGGAPVCNWRGRACASLSRPTATCNKEKSLPSPWPKITKEEGKPTGFQCFSRRLANKVLLEAV